MISAKNIKQLIKKIHVSTNATTDQKVREDVLEIMRRAKQTRPVHGRLSIWRMIMKTRISRVAAAAAVIIIVIVGISLFRGSLDGASLVWADVIEKLEKDIETTNTIHIVMRLQVPVPKGRKNGKEEFPETVTTKGEMWLKRNPFAAKMLLEGEQTAYVTEDKFVGLDHRRKIWFEQPLPKGKSSKYIYGMFEALGAGDFKAYLRISGYNISDGRMIGREIVAGENTTVYEFVGALSEEKREERQPTVRLKCWIRDSDRKTVRMHMDYGHTANLAIDFDSIEYNIAIPPDIFEVRIPEGYTKRLTPEERIRATVPANVVELEQAYGQARNAFPDYRMVTLDDRGYIKCRVVKEGKKWRKDTYAGYGSEDEIPAIKRFQDFDDLWRQTEVLSTLPWYTAMTYKGKKAIGFWPRKHARDLPKSLLRRYEDISEVMDSLECTAWPRMYIGEKNAKVTMLPSSQESSGCIGVSISYTRKGITHEGMNIPSVASLMIFWTDPSKDYICVRYERHQRPKAVWEEDSEWLEHEATANVDDGSGSFHSRIVKIRKTAQTPSGQWYPREIEMQYYDYNKDGARLSPSPKAKVRRIYVDTEGPIDPDLFEWPTELPQPTK